MAGSASTAGVERGFYNFDHQHQDLVLAFDYNFYGNRIVSASADLTLKVFHRRDDTWTLLDSWRAHDAEIVGVGNL